MPGGQPGRGAGTPATSYSTTLLTTAVENLSPAGLVTRGGGARERGGTSGGGYCLSQGPVGKGGLAGGISPGWQRATLTLACYLLGMPSSSQPMLRPRVALTTPVVPDRAQCRARPNQHCITFSIHLDISQVYDPGSIIDPNIYTLTSAYHTHLETGKRFLCQHWRQVAKHP